MRAFLVAPALLLSAASLLLAAAKGVAGPAGLKGAPIADQATRVSVPVAGDLFLSVGLPPHFWLQCPRNSRFPTGPALVYTQAEMRALILGAKAGDFDSLLV